MDDLEQNDFGETLDNIFDFIKGASYILIGLGIICFVLGLIINFYFCSSFKDVDSGDMCGNRSLAMGKCLNQMAGINGEISWYFAADITLDNVKIKKTRKVKRSSLLMRNIKTLWNANSKIKIMGVEIKRDKKMTLLYFKFNNSLKLAELLEAGTFTYKY